MMIDYRKGWSREACRDRRPSYPAIEGSLSAAGEHAVGASVPL